MKKEVIEQFMKLYSLGGLNDKVKWKYNATDKTLHARASKDSRTFITDVVMTGFDGFGTEDLLICIGDTNKVKLMMAPFGEDVNIAINRNGDRVLGFTVSDKDCESYCTAADPTAIEPAPKNLSDITDWNVSIPLTEEFLDKFLSSRRALDDVESFSMGMNKKGVFEIVLGYATANSNRIRITPTTDPGKDKIDIAMSFVLTNVTEVLKANIDIPDGRMLVSNRGVIGFKFKDATYTNNYFQFINQKKA